MQDRVPSPGQEGRMLITPEGGQVPFYATLEMADNPIQPGTPLNKQTLLTDVAAAMYGLDSSATVNDAFMALAIGVGKKGCLVTVVYPDGSPAQGYTVQGATGPDGETLVTDASGNCLAVTTGDSLTLSIPDPAELDVEPVAAQQVTLEGTITTVTLELSLVADVLTISSSVSKPVSKFCVRADFCGVGGGGGGCDYGSGGGGGYVANTLNVETPNSSTIAIQIGTGGATSLNDEGEQGGTTTVSVGGTVVLTAPGGKGGTKTIYDTSGSDDLYKGGEGNGNGGNSASPGGNPVSEEDYQAAVATATGKPGNVNLFNDPSLGLPGGGGGGALVDAFYYTASERPNTAGTPYGAMGAIQTNSGSLYLSAATPTGPGGGGGGGDRGSSSVDPSAGAAGAVFARFHREAA